jgi:hypothetical protein
MKGGVGREKIDFWVMPRVLKIAAGAKRTYRVKSRVKTVRVLTLQLQNLPMKYKTRLRHSLDACHLQCSFSDAVLMQIYNHWAYFEMTRGATCI